MTIIRSPHDYAVCMDWNFSHIERTAARGIAPYDADAIEIGRRRGEVLITRRDLVLWCRERAKKAGRI